jgi:hypothetical protein
MLVVIGIDVANEAGVGVGGPSGVTALAGGAPEEVEVKHPALLYVRETGQHQAEQLFVLVSSTGTTCPAYSYAYYGWSARLPAGTYRADRILGCSGPYASGQLMRFLPV